ncbi:DUF6191 domain-containing protein [Kibdelosporangium lantanae]|uniref:DUF6191 domain-containing protein n=1 Tax=Kibdelosporangium lantanae TaxID=1497396 RepID=A0ABW3M8Y3_9PSEU
MPCPRSYTYVDVMVWVGSIVGVAVWLVLLAVLERAWRRARSPRDAGSPMSEAAFDEFVAFFYGSKRVELAQRATHSLMREDENNSAPPHKVDLDNGVAFLDPHRIKE